MNLGSIITGLLGLVFGKKNWENWRMSSTEGEENYTDFGGTLDNVLAKYSGSRLTNAEQQANAFSALQGELAFNREADFQREMFDKQTQLANTQYQRTVADMQAAGINPMMASRSSGAVVPSGGSANSSAPQSVSPGSMGNVFPSILSAILRSKEIRLQEKALQADIDLKSSQAQRNRAETASTEQQTEYFAGVSGIRKAAEQASLNMTQSRINEINQSIEESRSRVSKNISETKELDKRADLHVEQAILARANAQNIEYLQSFIADVYRSEADLNDARVKLSIVDAAYRQGLIDEGAIQAAVRADNAHASEAEIDAKTKEFSQGMRDGTIWENASGMNRIGLRVYSIVSNTVKLITGKY